MALTTGHVSAEISGDRPHLSRHLAEQARLDPQIDPPVTDHPDLGCGRRRHPEGFLRIEYHPLGLTATNQRSTVLLSPLLGRAHGPDLGRCHRFVADR